MSTTTQQRTSLREDITYLSTIVPKDELLCKIYLKTIVIFRSTPKTNLELFYATKFFKKMDTDCPVGHFELTCSSKTTINTYLLKLD